MGVKNLFKLIKEEAPTAVRTITLEDLRGWAIGIDASLSIYQWCAVGFSRQIKNIRGEYVNHIRGAFYRTVSMISAGIIPVYIFDGKPPIVKNQVITERKVARENGKAVRVPREVFAEVARLLELLGVMVIYAPSEAEAQAAVMTPALSGPDQAPLAAVATEDMDVLAFGAKYMIRELDTGGKNLTLIDTAAVLDALGFTLEQFVDLCILLGCDYTTTIPGIGPRRALKFMRKYGSIEAILVGEKITTPAEFDYVSARKEFLSPAVAQIDIVPQLRQLAPKDITALEEFLVDKHGLEATTVKKSLDILVKTLGTTA